MKNLPLPPKAQKIPFELTAHGHLRTDPYYWMREREDPKVLDYLQHENEYTQAMLAHTVPLQEKLYTEMKGRIKEEDQSVPYFRNGYWYYVRYTKGSEYPVYGRKKESLDANEEMLLDVNLVAEGQPYCDVSGIFVSPDNQTMAYGVDFTGRRQYEIRFMDLQTQEMYEHSIHNTTGSIAWANDNKTCFYSVKNEALRSYKIMRHNLNTADVQDVEVYHEDDNTFYCYVYRSKTGRFIIIGSGSTLTTEYHLLDADDPEGEFGVFAARQRGVEYHIADDMERWLVLTNLEAPNFRLMECNTEKTSQENWLELIPHRKYVRLENVETFSDYLVCEERENGLIKFYVIKKGSGSSHYINFGEETYTAWIGTNYDYGSSHLRYQYSSLTTPVSTFDYDLKTQEKTLQKQQEVLGDFNPDYYHAQRLQAKAEDGQNVPISLVYRKDKVKLNGSDPLLLYAYGSYGISMDAQFSHLRLSLLDRGFIFAIAHIRGGEDLGRTWYEEGKLLKKKNTFTDFIACAEHLIRKKFTNQKHLYAMGGSAGGLLVGTVINLRPDLFRAIVAAVPFVDVVTTMLDETIPLTTGEYDEWGNPNIKEYYEYMLSYSPYDNVQRKDYPAMLVTTGLHDSQVQYWEPAKWVARLRDMKTDNNLLLLHTNMEAGHGGASGRFQRLKEVALEYAFLLDLEGVGEQ